MRLRSIAAALLLALAVAGSAQAEDRPRQRLGKVTIKIAQVFPETRQALVFDKATGKHVVVTEGDTLGKYEIVEVGDDEVVVRVSGRELVLPSEIPAAAAAPAPGPATPLLDPYAPAAPAPVSAPAPGGPLDPYGDPAPVSVAPAPTGPIREVLAPPAQRAGTTTPAAAPVDPYAPVPAKPAAPTPGPTTPAPGPATPAPPPTPAVEAIRLESMTIKRAELSAALADFDKLAKDIGFVRTGTGVRLTTVAPGTYYFTLGLRSGDLVTAIDGAQLRTLDDAAGAYARLGSAKKLAISILRGGERGTLRFALK